MACRVSAGQLSRTNKEFILKTVFIFSALGEIALLLALFWAGRKHVLGGLRRPYSGLSRLPKEPRAAMIIPITGDTPAVRAGLENC